MLETKNNLIGRITKFASISVLGMFLFSILSVSVLADEWWTSNVGVITWEDSVNNTAVFVYTTPNSDHEKTRMFIRNLVPDTTGTRGTYTGYWTDDSDRELCEASLIDPKGTVTHRWGRLTITFAKSPKGLWDFTAKVGNCFDEPSRAITAKS